MFGAILIGAYKNVTLLGGEFQNFGKQGLLRNANTSVP
jgi:hypothetical protein